MTLLYRFCKCIEDTDDKCKRRNWDPKINLKTSKEANKIFAHVVKNGKSPCLEPLETHKTLLNVGYTSDVNKDVARDQDVEVDPSNQTRVVDYMDLQSQVARIENLKEIRKPLA